MLEKHLSIEITKGTWMLDVVAERNDDGVYDLVYPKKEATIHVKEDHMYGLEYNISAPEGTPFKIVLDGEMLLDSQVDHTGICRGSCVI
ncbi:hypothetical protein [Alteromonas sp. C1M14]|uniref:hypothetical protein n=1 Tax=Alteromonas sp. C1M14 TaxID=2841567 RepID=UPI001C09580C|nr:hypothetical protein [Alteromonas sp. C1M14]MBU2979474.1 hypothetical protein [Alteromonas sp. C1M14]